LNASVPFTAGVSYDPGTFFDQGRLTVIANAPNPVLGALPFTIIAAFAFLI